MTNVHDRFEALAGALALGEATADERACFEAHARDCTLCCEESDAPLLRAFVETTRDAESWRPSLRDTIFARIHERRLGRSRFAIGALGWAFAISVVLNAAVVSGAAASFGRAFRDREPVSDVVATRIRLDAMRPALVPTRVPLHAFVRGAQRQHAGIGRIRVTKRPPTVVLPKRRYPRDVAIRPAMSQTSPEAKIDDILAGLDLAGAGGVAMAPLARCQAAATASVLRPETCATPPPSDP